MAWTASITSTEKVSDYIVVTVRYTDGIKIIDEAYKSYGAPASEWIEKTVDSKLSALTGIDSSTIPTGDVAKPTPEDASKVKFRELLRKVPMVNNLIAIGALRADDTKVQDMVDFLTANAETYWDMI